MKCDNMKNMLTCQRILSYAVHMLYICCTKFVILTMEFCLCIFPKFSRGTKGRPGLTADPGS